ncbi:MATE family efflux transporter [Cohaesibacter celericrescens]|uniref:Uncharacterized protein n=1 Tax=Cohaesibacter celericrescens TaxID=2067669 RepID=A0A2N5XV78_9HYPH|nr:MATE family efflux transporter [Cohaesibacter celericrescens]PLW78380.1 hypothetical protein C0081_04610 [Cohaesibacter celericrescens]
MNASPTHSEFFDRGTPSILRLAGFLSLSGLFATSAILIDANMVAPIGDETLAGLGLSAGLYGLFMAVLFGLGSAAQILLTRAFGTGEMGLFYRRQWRFLALGLGLSLLLVLLFRFNIHFLVDLLATTSGVGFAAKRYLELMVYGLPISYAAYLLSLSFDVRRQASRELRGFVIEVPLNLVLNALLIYGWFGAPELGIKGAAIATLISQGARLVYLIGLTIADYLAGSDKQKTASEADMPRSVLIPVTLNVAALIVGAQAYQLLFSQLSYLDFAALALMVPWLSISNVLGRAIALSATISCADLEKGSDAMKQTIGSILAALRLLAPRLALTFVGITLLVGGLSWHISGAVRINFLMLIPLAGLLVLIRTASVTIGAILRATDRPKWVFWVQVGLLWGFGVPLLMLLTYLFDLPLYAAFCVLICEEMFRLGIMAGRLHKIFAPSPSCFQTVHK